MRSTLIGSLTEICSADWNRLSGTRQPFLRHEFLAGLERHRCVGEQWGWVPQHLLLYDVEERLIGAMPQYLKTNSYGELVFDWAWADAYRRHGLRYYPKLVSAIPYTPATGPRLLLAPEADPEATAQALIEAAIEQARRLEVSSLHWLFPDEADRNRLSAHGLGIRTGCQFHWHNQGYRDFGHYLERFTSDKRKKIRRERRLVAESGVSIHCRPGEDMSEAQWEAMHRHYRSTFERLSGYATLSLDFFRALSQELPGQLVIFQAEYQGRPVASAICLRDDQCLYGRHWGCDEQFDNLHFELCYYQGLEYCIREGLARFEPGAQGEHKISRGFLPTPTWSAHWIADPQFRAAIDDFLQRETSGMQHYIAELGEHSPFKEN